jgi:hypothetical protein
MLVVILRHKYGRLMETIRMHPYSMARVSGAVVLPLAACSTPTRTEPHEPTFTPDQKATIGSGYAAAHLTSACARG